MILMMGHHQLLTMVIDTAATIIIIIIAVIFTTIIIVISTENTSLQSIRQMIWPSNDVTVVTTCLRVCLWYGGSCPALCRSFAAAATHPPHGLRLVKRAGDGCRTRAAILPTNVVLVFLLLAVAHMASV